MFVHVEKELFIGYLHTQGYQFDQAVEDGMMFFASLPFCFYNCVEPDRTPSHYFYGIALRLMLVAGYKIKQI